MFDFKNKVVVVTGGARGIGRCISEKFCDAGATVCVIDLLQNEYFVGDIADKETLERFHQKVIADFRHIFIFAVAADGQAESGALSVVGCDEFAADTLIFFLIGSYCQRIGFIAESQACAVTPKTGFAPLNTENKTAFSRDVALVIHRKAVTGIGFYLDTAIFFVAPEN